MRGMACSRKKRERGGNGLPVQVRQVSEERERQARKRRTLVDERSGVHRGAGVLCPSRKDLNQLRRACLQQVGLR